MKKIFAVVLCLALCMSLAACGGSEKQSTSGTNIITGYKSGDVTLGQYTGLNYTPFSTEVTDDEVEEAFKALMEANKEKVEVTDRYDIREGDFVTVDFVGKKDGVEFEGGTGTKEDLEIGSNTFIQDFEQGLIGKKNGTSFTIDVTFPENYKNADLAGKPATFDITVKGIKEWKVPEATDEFISEKTSGKITTIEGLRSELKNYLKEEKVENAEAQKQSQIFQKIIEKTTFNVDIEQKFQQKVEKLNVNANKNYGMDAEALYTMYYGITSEEFNTIFHEQVKMELILSAVAEAERFTVTEEEIEQRSQELMQNYQTETIDECYLKIAEEYGATSGRDCVKDLIKLEKAEELIFSSAVPVADSGSGSGTQK